jgi:hypothetical protein
MLAGLIIGITLTKVRHKINTINVFLLITFFMIIIYAYFMFNNGFGINFRLMWFRFIEVFFQSLIFILAVEFSTNYKNIIFTEINKIIPLLFIIIFGSLAYVFGTGNHIIHAMSNSMIFIMASLIIVNFILDKKLHTRVFTTLTGLMMSILIYLSINNGNAHPYRLITNISEQTQRVELLGGLYVDKITKKYINDLQYLSKKYNADNKQISLIDMTGGSPGANVILNASFFGQVWLLGGYKGSIPFAQKILQSYSDTVKLKQSWILVAPDGSIKLDLNILNRVGLDFPNAYIKIGTVKTAHRNETQELWIPNNAK